MKLKKNQALSSRMHHILDTKHMIVPQRVHVLFMDFNGTDVEISIKISNHTKISPIQKKQQKLNT